MNRNTIVIVTLLGILGLMLWRISSIIAMNKLPIDPLRPAERVEKLARRDAEASLYSDPVDKKWPTLVQAGQIQVDAMLRLPWL